MEQAQGKYDLGRSYFKVKQYERWLILSQCIFLDIQKARYNSQGLQINIQTKQICSSFFPLKNISLLQLQFHQRKHSVSKIRAQSSLVIHHSMVGRVDRAPYTTQKQEGFKRPPNPKWPEPFISQQSKYCDHISFCLHSIGISPSSIIFTHFFVAW